MSRGSSSGRRVGLMSSTAQWNIACVVRTPSLPYTVFAELGRGSCVLLRRLCAVLCCTTIAARRRCWPAAASALTVPAWSRLITLGLGFRRATQLRCAGRGQR
jgi:hypothetical protein